MIILVVNAGSSSLKYQLIDMSNEEVLAKGNCSRIGIDGLIEHKLANGRKFSESVALKNHTDAFKELVKILTTGDYKAIDTLAQINAIGHRIVQGAEFFTSSTLVTDEVINKIEEISDLAPLHNPAHIQAIRACIDVFPKDIVQVVVFDTAFHQTMPKKAYMFGVPYDYYTKYNVRRYGFHGTSHRFVSAKLALCMNRNIKNLKIVTCHLGNGSSIAAIDRGECVDTSMGFTPLDGLLMGTRSGSVDPSVILYIMEKENLSAKQMNDLLNKESGVLGISGVTSDDRDLRKAAAEGNERAQLASDMQRYQIKKYIGSYAAAMGGLDALVFTGGIGENSASLREDVCSYMEFLGIEIDYKKNVDLSGQEAEISTPNSKVKVWIIPTNEELLIARDTKNIIEKIR